MLNAESTERMPVLPTVGRRSIKIRLVIALIYTLLIAGGITMVVPFMVMVTTSVSNEADYQRYDVLPAYWFREDLRFAKYLAAKYEELPFAHFAVAHGAPENWSTFRGLGYENEEDLVRYFADLKDLDPAHLERIAADYREFLAACPPGTTVPLFKSWSEVEIQEFLRAKYSRRIEAGQTGGAELAEGSESEQALDLLSRTWNEGLFVFWDYVNFKQELQYPYHLRRWVPPDDARQRDYEEYVRAAAPSKKIPTTTRYFWCRFLLDQGVQVGRIDRRFGTRYQSIYRIPPGDVADLPEPLKKLWDEFWPYGWPVRLMEIPPELAGEFPAQLSRQHDGDISALNEALGTDFGDFASIPAARRLPKDSRLRRSWISFVVAALERLRERARLERAPGPPDAQALAKVADAARWPVEKWRRLSPEADYRRFLRRKYARVGTLNEAYGWKLASIDRAELPIREVDYYDYSEHAGRYVWKFTTHNFSQIFRFIAVRGRALWNTLILVVLTILFTLTVNPLAAYALSRFRLRGTQQILIYLLATMAFPPEVGMIPGFLLLRDLHLLNTFPALILPGAANGFTVFLLKGFFDSLPQELYEAAAIDGASEVRMFAMITLPLTKPILAVIALHAFIVSYGSFMWAFLVCQDPDMWTLMVWLYQFNTQNPSQPLMFAAIVVASIPTLLVFISCQRIILRGIVIPSMK